MKAKTLAVFGLGALGGAALAVAIMGGGCTARADDATVTMATCNSFDPITYELPDSDPATWPRVSAWISDQGAIVGPLPLVSIQGTTARFGDCPSKSGGGAGTHTVTFVLR